MSVTAVTLKGRVILKGKTQNATQECDSKVRRTLTDKAGKGFQQYNSKCNSETRTLGHKGGRGLDSSTQVQLKTQHAGRGCDRGPGLFFTREVEKTEKEPMNYGDTMILLT